MRMKKLALVAVALLANGTAHEERITYLKTGHHIRILHLPEQDALHSLKKEKFIAALRSQDLI